MDRGCFQQRWFQYALFVPNLIGFAIVLLTAFLARPSVVPILESFLYGCMVGGAIVFLIPFGGRFWCTVCPPRPGEWLDHGAVIEKGNESPLSKAVRITQSFEKHLVTERRVSRRRHVQCNYF